MPHPPNKQLAIYADDTAILAQSWRTDTVLHRLTHATSILFRYFTRWKLQTIIHKTEDILFTRRRLVPPTSLHFQHVVIPWNSQVQYFGLPVDSKLLFKRHLTSAIHKPTGMFNQIFTLLTRDSTLSITNKLTFALCSYTLPLFAATLHPTTIADCKFYNPNVSESLANTQAQPHPASSCHLKRHTYP